MTVASKDCKTDRYLTFLKEKIAALNEYRVRIDFLLKKLSVSPFKSKTEEIVKLFDERVKLLLKQDSAEKAVKATTVVNSSSSSNNINPISSPIVQPMSSGLSNILRINRMSSISTNSLNSDFNSPAIENYQRSPLNRRAFRSGTVVSHL